MQTTDSLMVIFEPLPHRMFACRSRAGCLRLCGHLRNPFWSSRPLENRTGNNRSTPPHTSNLQRVPGYEIPQSAGREAHFSCREDLDRGFANIDDQHVLTEDFVAPSSRSCRIALRLAASSDFAFTGLARSLEGGGFGPDHAHQVIPRIDK